MSSPSGRTIRSWVWTYFEEIYSDTQKNAQGMPLLIAARCSRCLAEYPHYNNTSNYARHLVNQHGIQNPSSSTSLRRCAGATTGAVGTRGGRHSGIARTGFARLFRQSNQDCLASSLPQPQDENCSPDISAPDNVNAALLSSLSEGMTSPTRGSGAAFLVQQSLSQVDERRKRRQPGHPEYESVLDAILYMICADKLPIWTVNKKGFLNLMSVVSKWFKVPDRKTIARMIKHKYAAMVTHYQDIFDNVTDLTITGDLWTETLNNKSYIGLTATCLKEPSCDMNALRTIKIGIFSMSEAHTAEHIAAKIKSIFNIFKISLKKILMFITDHADNIKNAIKALVGEENHHKKWIGCIGHKFNLVVTHAIRDTAGLQNLIDSMKKIVTYFRKSSKAMSELRDQQIIAKLEDADYQILKLIQDVVTRWNSEYYMMQRYIIIEEQVNVVLMRPSHTLSPLTKEESKCASEITKLMKPFDLATRTLSADKIPTLSSVIPVISVLRCELKSLESTLDTQIAIGFAKNLTHQLNRYFNSVEQNYIYAMSTVLDPRYKRLHIDRPVDAALAISNIKDLITKMPISDNETYDYSTPQDDNVETSDDFWRHHEVRRKRLQESDLDSGFGLPEELKLYLKQKVISRQEDPIKFWDQNSLLFPRLSILGKRYVSGISCSTPSERMFSEAGAIFEPARNRLSSEMAQCILTLGSIPLDEWAQIKM